MATIDLYKAYQQKVRKFGVNDSERFRSSFVEAVNMVYAELNDQVFQNQSLEYIDYFGDVIDSRLVSFGSMTFDSDPDYAIESREFWSIEYELERTSATNGFTDTINDDASDVVISIADGVLSVAGDTVAGSLTLVTASEYKIKFESYADGNRVFVNGEEYALTYTTGDAGTTQKIGTVNTHIINGVSGFELKTTRFYTSGTVVYEFLMEEETTDTQVTDTVHGYTAALTSVQWDDRWISQSSGLDDQYRSVLDMGLDYHLQDGGEWAIEPESERERKWYLRGIKFARNIYQNNSTYTSPLGI